MGAPAEVKAKVVALAAESERTPQEEPPCYPNAILEAEALCQLDIPEKQTYLHPWLSELSIFLITAWRGAGKTGFILGILNAITKGLNFGPWKCGESVNCVYVDGEMATQDVIKRLKEQGTGDRRSKLYIYSDAYAHSIGLPKANLLNPQWQEGIRTWMKEHDIRLWVIDNLASLSGGIDENSKESWDPIGKFLLSLRYEGISTGLIHHEGKGGVQRGTSAREDHADVCIALKKPNDYRADQGARFIATFTKSRIPTEHLPLIADIEFQFMKTIGDVSEWTWKSAADSLRYQILHHLDAGISQTDIAGILGTSKGQVSKIRAKAIKDGWLTEKNRLTQVGFQHAGTLGN